MASRQLSLVFDFDGTITKQDTIGVLADAAQRFQHERQINTSPSWTDIVEAYGHDHEQHTASYQPMADERRGLVEELRFLRGLRDVELRSLRRVESSGLFKGMDQDMLYVEGKKAVRDGIVQIRDGFPEVMEVASRNAWHVSVLSVNWSASFIQGVLDGFPVGTIIANEVQGDGNVHGPEILGPHCRETVLTTCQDKHRALAALMARDAVGADDVVYFGDSTSDIECLLLGRGVTVAENDGSRLLKTLRRIGLEVPWAGVGRPPGNLVCSSSFREVLEGGFLE